MEMALMKASSSIKASHKAAKNKQVTAQVHKVR